MPESEDLKRKAEALIKEKFGDDLEKNFAHDAQKLMHELAVHQIELELQNEELQQSQHDLETARDRFVNLFQHSPMAFVVVDPQGQITDANQEAALLFQKDKNRLLKISFYTLAPQANQNILYNHLETILKTKKRSSVEMILKKADGTNFHAKIFSMRIENLDDEVFACHLAILDVTQQKEFEALLEENITAQTQELTFINRNMKKEIDVRKQAEAELRQELFFRKTIEKAIPAGICAANQDGRIIYVNETFCKLFGYDENELLNSFPPYFFWPDDDKDKRLKCFFDVKFEMPEIEGEVKKYQRKDGKNFWGLFSLAPLPHAQDNRKKGFLASVVDVTRRKQAEDHLKISEKRLRVLNRKLIDAQEAERARISKDLHDSIGASLIAVQFAVERKLKEIGEAACEKEVCLEEVIGMLQNIVVDTRRISKNLLPVSLEQLGLKSAVKSYCKNFDKGNPDIVFEYEVDIQEETLPERMKLMLFRMTQEGLNNVVKHSQAEHVWFVLTQNDGRIIFDMVDDGQGFDLKSVQSDETGDDSTGLGLQSLAERVESFGGKLTIKSTVGLGARIHAEWEPHRHPTGSGRDGD